MTHRSEHPPTLQAWVDESMLIRPREAGDSYYLLAATIADPARCDDVRDGLRGLLAGGRRRLHWRDETDTRRRKIAELSVAYELEHVVVVGAPLDERKQERARRVCLEVLLGYLDGLGVHSAVIESRRPTQDDRDLRMLDAVRSKGMVSINLSLSFSSPTSEPMLWMPDAVAGAIGQSFRGGDDEPRKILETTATELAVFVR